MVRTGLTLGLPWQNHHSQYGLGCGSRTPPLSRPSAPRTYYAATDVPDHFRWWLRLRGRSQFCRFLAGLRRFIYSGAGLPLGLSAPVFVCREHAVWPCYNAHASVCYTSGSTRLFHDSGQRLDLTGCISEWVFICLKAPLNFPRKHEAIGFHIILHSWLVSLPTTAVNCEDKKLAEELVKQKHSHPHHLVRPTPLQPSQNLRQHQENKGHFVTRAKIIKWSWRHALGRTQRNCPKLGILVLKVWRRGILTTVEKKQFALKLERLQKCSCEREMQIIKNFPANYNCQDYAENMTLHGRPQCPLTDVYNNINFPLVKTTLGFL